MPWKNFLKRSTSQVVASDAQLPRDIATHYPVELVPIEDSVQLAAALQRHCAAGRRRIACALSEFSLEPRRNAWRAPTGRCARRGAARRAGATRVYFSRAPKLRWKALRLK
jgi:hypothetical protein